MSSWSSHMSTKHENTISSEWSVCQEILSDSRVDQSHYRSLEGADSSLYMSHTSRRPIVDIPISRTTSRGINSSYQLIPTGWWVTIDRIPLTVDSVSRIVFELGPMLTSSRDPMLWVVFSWILDTSIYSAKDDSSKVANSSGHMLHDFSRILVRRAIQNSRNSMFFLINKPIGFTSFDVIRKLRGMTGIKKMWHTGTLDPLATGALLIATDSSTKLISRLEMANKTYLFTVDMSITSPSLDMEWAIERVNITSMKNHTIEEVREFLENHTTQIPPKYSAIHIDGKRAYELVRKWKEFHIPERPISVSGVEIVDITLPKITIRLTISAGGYIRSFAPLLGEFFWVPGGGCVTHLHRERIGNIDLTRSMGFDDLDMSNSIPYSDLLMHIPVYHLDIAYQKPLIDGLIVDVGTLSERESGWEILISCGDITSIGKWTPRGIEVIRNYV